MLGFYVAPLSWDTFWRLNPSLSLATRGLEPKKLFKMKKMAKIGLEVRSQLVCKKNQAPESIPAYSGNPHFILNPHNSPFMTYYIFIILYLVLYCDLYIFT